MSKKNLKSQKPKAQFRLKFLQIKMQLRQFVLPKKKYFLYGKQQN